MKFNNTHNALVLPTYLVIFQVAFIILMGFFAQYKFDKESSEIPGLYAMFMDVHSMMFVGFGFLMTFLKRYGYSSIGFNFILAAYVLEWAILVHGWFEMSLDGSKKFFTIELVNLLQADFCAAAILISFGAILGEATLSQLILMATIEVVLQIVNEYIGVNYLMAYDIGESIYVHTFGAYFGLAAAKVLTIGRKTESEKESSTYHSDLFSMIGTLFLWLYWPSFNSATASEEGRLRAIINTFLSITASCVCTFIMSLYANKGKLSMIHIQNATLAGGVAVGAIADMCISPFGALIVGSVAGFISTIGYQYLTPILNHNVHDTCGVNNLHGMPGIISGLASAVVAALATSDNYHDRLFIYFPSRIPQVNSTEYINKGLASTEYANGGPGRTAGQQAAYQLAALGVTLGIALLGGAITGGIMRLPILQQIDEEERLFDDEPYWQTPSDFENLLKRWANDPDVIRQSNKSVNLVGARINISSLHNIANPDLRVI